MYKELYLLGKQLPKRDRFGMHTRIEETLLTCLTLSIQSALAAKKDKSALLRLLQVELEVCKHIVRLAHELKMYTEKHYWDIEKQLRDISRQTASWYNYTKRSH